MPRVDMFRLAFAAAIIFLLWLQSLFTTTTHTVTGNHHVFKYGWVAWFFFALFVVVLLGFAWVAWRHMKDKVIAGITIAGIPLMAFAVLPQTCFERVEITEELLIHRREPPHTEYNADIRLDEIASVTEIKKESGSFSTFYLVGYEIVTDDGKRYELPCNTVLTAAHETINAVLGQRNIAIQTQVLKRQPQ